MGQAQLCTTKCCKASTNGNSFDLKQAHRDYLARCDKDAAAAQVAFVSENGSNTSGNGHGANDGHAASPSEEPLLATTAAPKGPNYFDAEVDELRRALADKSPDVQENRATYVFSSGATYTGQWKGHERHGHGLHRWADGTIYEGQWLANRADGRGCFRRQNGDTYIGEWKHNTAHGQGVYRTDVFQYTGEWYNDLQEGLGVEVPEEGARFEGCFRAGQKNGHGVYSWSDGSQYWGTWVNNCTDGYGIYQGDDGRTFKGMWRDSSIHGIGEYVWQDGRWYCGQFAKDKKEGFGIFVWPDGRRYEGYWVKGRQHGAGRSSATGAAMRESTWKHGKRARARGTFVGGATEYATTMTTGTSYQTTG